MTVNDYMMALLERFTLRSPEEDELRVRLAEACARLREALAPEGEKLLMRLLDQESELQDELVLYGFLSGYRLADGIHRELGRYPPFSYMADAEEHGRQEYEKERTDENAGKNQESLRADP